MDKTRLIFDNATEIAGNKEIGILSLTDLDKTRQLSIVCERNVALEIDKRKSPEPVNDNLLPEVLVKLLTKNTNSLFEILITDIVDGQYKVYVFNADTLDYTPIRASDAVLLSMVADIPIFISETLMRQQSVEYTGKKTGVTVPINAISIPMLEESLKKAIDSENYEMASKLRDEINKRKKDS